MGGYTQGYFRIRDINARELGLNGVSLDSTQTSSTFSVEGYTQMTTKVLHTNSSATAVQFYFEESDDGVNWVRAQTALVSAGTETLSDHTVEKAVSGDVNYHHQLPVTANLGRLVFTSTSGDASDTVTVSVRLGVTG